MGFRVLIYLTEVMLITAVERSRKPLSACARIGEARYQNVAVSMLLMLWVQMDAETIDLMER